MTTSRSWWWLEAECFLIDFSRRAGSGKYMIKLITTIAYLDWSAWPQQWWQPSSQVSGYRAYTSRRRRVPRACFASGPLQSLHWQPVYTLQMYRADCQRAQQRDTSWRSANRSRIALACAENEPIIPGNFHGPDGDVRTSPGLYPLGD